MKQLTQSIAALSMAFVLAACGGTSFSSIPQQSAAVAQSAMTPLAFLGADSTAKLKIKTSALSGWVVELPGKNKFLRAKLTDCQNPFWAAPIGKSKWISANKAFGCQGSNVPAGHYIYEYTFCPANASGTPFLTLDVLADNAFDINLNGHDFDPNPFQGDGTGSPFMTPQTVSTSAGFSKTAKNVLQIIVNNDGGETGLDASGFATGVQPSC